jgi:hypothetical protein
MVDYASRFPLCLIKISRASGWLFIAAWCIGVKLSRDLIKKNKKKKIIFNSLRKIFFLELSIKKNEILSLEKILNNT